MDWFLFQFKIMIVRMTDKEIQGCTCQAHSGQVQPWANKGPGRERAAGTGCKQRAFLQLHTKTSPTGDYPCTKTDSTRNISITFKLQSPSSYDRPETSPKVRGETLGFLWEMTWLVFSPIQLSSQDPPCTVM